MEASSLGCQLLCLHSFSQEQIGECERINIKANAKYAHSELQYSVYENVILLGYGVVWTGKYLQTFQGAFYFHLHSLCSLSRL